MDDQTGVMQPDKQEMSRAEETERTRQRPVFVPRADIYETDDAIMILADVPGADESSVDITLEKNVLTISVTIRDERPEKYSLTHAEYGVGDYERSFILSNQVDREKIEATVKDGVLNLHLPKAAQAQTRKINVRAG